MDTTSPDFSISAPGRRRVTRRTCRHIVIVLSLLCVSSACNGAFRTNEIQGDTFDIVVTRFSDHRPIRNIRAVMRTAPSQVRIVMYWLQPPQITEPMDNLARADLLLKGRHLWCWFYKGINGKQQFEFDLSRSNTSLEFPKNGDLADLMRATLAITRESTQESPLESAGLLGMNSFFAQCGQQKEVEHIIQAKPEALLREVHNESTADLTCMSHPPSGRVYRKTTLSDGLTMWSMSDALEGRSGVFVKVNATESPCDLDPTAPFQAQSLGSVTCIPEPYRQFWVFEQRYTEVSQQDPETSAASDLCTDIEARLARNLPRDMVVPLCDLRVRTALRTGSRDTVARAIDHYVTAFLAYNSGSMEEAVFALQHICAEMAQYYSEEDTRNLAVPFVKRLSEFSAFDNPFFVQDTLDVIIRQGDCSYGQLWIDALRQRGHISAEVLDSLSKHLEMRRLSTNIEAPDDSALRVSARDYIQHVGLPAVPGDMSLGDVRILLAEGLVRRLQLMARDDKEAQYVERILNNIRTVAGEGPFRGNQAEVRTAIADFDKLYAPELVSDQEAEVVLSTLLLLSFKDCSTPQDREEVQQQLRDLFDELIREVATVFAQHQLSGSAEQKASEEVLLRQRSSIPALVDNLLWPMFKYPLTQNERTRVLNRAKREVLRLDEFIASALAVPEKDGRWKTQTVSKLRTHVLRTAISVPVGVVVVRLPQMGGFGYNCGANGRPRLTMRFSFEDADKAREIVRAAQYLHVGHQMKRQLDREGE